MNRGLGITVLCSVAVLALAGCSSASPTPSGGEAGDGGPDLSPSLLTEAPVGTSVPFKDAAGVLDAAARRDGSWEASWKDPTGSADGPGVRSSTVGGERWVATLGPDEDRPGEAQVVSVITPDAVYLRAGDIFHGLVPADRWVREDALADETVRGIATRLAWVPDLFELAPGAPVEVLGREGGRTRLRVVLDQAAWGRGSSGPWLTLEIANPTRPTTTTTWTVGDDARVLAIETDDPAAARRITWRYGAQVPRVQAPPPDRVWTMGEAVAAAFRAQESAGS
ncbi:hypothetical protein [Phycicoccus flavus]|uniref:hypothetical protein n=1 Tax=Phycicoccus flavus TaxID=2502783 RepID=UPI000FEBBA99|nr:hypothetical protein [Phycicoccus flavus]NHA67995.1 hypothetical protein [Phycicoccus flavus]